MNVPISQLKSAHELSNAVYKLTTPEELLQWAADGIAPCYLVTKPGREEVAYLFASSEVIDWMQNDWCRRQDGIKPVVNLNFLASPASSPRSIDIPECLMAIENLKQLPLKYHARIPGIYFLCRERELVYVGQSISVVDRLETHLQENIKAFDSAFFIRVPKQDLLEVETALIRHYRPRYNATCSREVTLGNRETINQYVAQATSL